MMNWFDTDDYEYADWARNSMEWEDVKDKAIKLKEPLPTDCDRGWWTGEYEYRTVTD